MADRTHIEWTDATWNPITGCSIVSPGCTNCYAMRLAGTRLKHTPSRAGLTKDSKAGPVWTGEVRFNRKSLDQPLRWKRPRKIFPCAHGDLFAEDVPDEWIDQVFAVMALSQQHIFQVLTKREKRMRRYLSDPATIRRVYGLVFDMVIERNLYVALIAPGIDERQAPPAPRIYLDRWPLPNVWLGVSAEDQKRADERIPDLLATPAAVRFVSAEPLLGPIDFTTIDDGFRDGTRLTFNALTGWAHDGEQPITGIFGHPDPKLDWVIVGGESGPGARPMHPDWARSIRDQCAAAGTSFFFKQWGEWAAVSQMSEEQIDACYPQLTERRPEATRHSLVDTHVLHADGSRHRAVFLAFLQGTSAMTMFAIGKRRAGRLLDGVTHDAMPEPRHD